MVTIPLGTHTTRAVRGNTSAEKLSHRIGCGLVVCTLMISTAGCFSTTEPEVEAEPEAKELTTKSTTPVPDSSTEDDLLYQGKRLYQSSMYTISRDPLRSLHERYPMGAFAQFAEIKVADSYFYNREYMQASKHYEDFIKNYPGSPDLSYVQLQAARSWTASTQGTGRDRQPLEKALTLYDEIVQRYPQTEYATLAERERVPVIQQLVAYDTLIIEFYRKRDNPAASDARQKEFNDRWGDRIAAINAAPHTVAPPAMPLRSLAPPNQLP